MELKKEEYVSDQDNIVAISTKVVFDGTVQTVILEAAKLRKAMEIVKTLGWDDVAINVQTDRPLLIAHEIGEQKGIIIAPKVS